MLNLVADCVKLLDEWPSSRAFSVEDALRERAEFGHDERAYGLLIAEEFIRRLEQGEAVEPASFLQQFPDAPRSLHARLEKVVDLNDRTRLLDIDVQAEQSFPKPGERICGYLLLEEIGRGSYSRVFVAADRNAGHRRVVVKLTTGGRAESELLGPLAHPNLPRILWCGMDPDRKLNVICMEFAGYRTLIDEILEIHQATRGHDEIDLSKRVGTLMRHIVSGLAHAHDHGLLHLDIKPGNVVLAEDGRAVLIDFNLGAPSAYSHEVAFRGTPAYAAPELLASAANGHLGVQPVSAACDIYSLGVVMYELLTGELPQPMTATEKSAGFAMDVRSTSNPAIRRPLTGELECSRRLG